VSLLLNAGKSDLASDWALNRDGHGNQAGCGATSRRGLRRQLARFVSQVGDSAFRLFQTSSYPGRLRGWEERRHHEHHRYV
jgi:hypothetical protein